MSNQEELKKWSFETRALNVGQEHTKCANDEMVSPIVTSATFHLNDPTKLTVKPKFQYFFCHKF